MLLIQKEKPKKHKNVYKFPMILHLMSHRVKIQTWKPCLSRLNLVHISIKQDPQEKQSLLNSRRGSPDSHTALVTAVGGAWNREMGGCRQFSERATVPMVMAHFHTNLPRLRWDLLRQLSPGGSHSPQWLRNAEGCNLPLRREGKGKAFSSRVSKLSVKGQVRNILGFLGHMVSASAAQN